MVRRIFYLQAVWLFAGAVFVMAGVTPMRAWAEQTFTPNEVYSRVTQIILDLSEIRKENAGMLLDQSVNSSLLKNQIKPRHVYQQALDVNRRLNAILRMVGRDINQEEVLEFREYSPTDVRRLVDRMFDGVSHLREANAMGARKNKPRKFKNKRPVDVHTILGRAEIFLAKLGAPGAQPADVLVRAKVISKLLAMLCRSPACVLPVRLTGGPPNKRPIDVYIKVYELIEECHMLVDAKGWKVPGGIVALAVNSGTVSPTSVNRALGTLLADMISLHVTFGLRGAVPLPERDATTVPGNVWAEINYAIGISKAVKRQR